MIWNGNVHEEHRGSSLHRRLLSIRIWLLPTSLGPSMLKHGITITIYIHSYLTTTNIVTATYVYICSSLIVISCIMFLYQAHHKLSVRQAQRVLACGWMPSTLLLLHFRSSFLTRGTAKWSEQSWRKERKMQDSKCYLSIPTVWHNGQSSGISGEA